MIRNLLLNIKNSEKTAVIEKDREISYRELIKKSFLLRSFLPVKKCENIAVLLPNGGDFIAAFWGVLAHGMIVFPLSILMTKHEIIPLLKQTNTKIVITSLKYKNIFNSFETAEETEIKIIYTEDLKISDDIDDKGNFTNLNISSSKTDEPMVLLITSGTTGKYKVVQLSEKNVETSVLGYLDKLELRSGERKKSRFTLAAPFSSVYGIMILSACLSQSIPLVVLEYPFTLDLFYKTVEEHKITHYEGGAAIITLMEQTIGKPISYDISTLKYFGTGGSMISGDVIEKLFDYYEDKYFYHGYGMTEASPLITKHPRGRVKKTNSVGTAIKGMEITVETESGIVTKPFVKGEIIVKGRNVMLGYYGDREETKKTLKNNYLYTGDIGYLDNEGYLYLCGRKKNIIIVRGFKVFPEEVEECIMSSSLVKDCVVYGQTDETGEIVCADIVPLNENINTDDIKAYCAEFLAVYKQPEKITFYDKIKKNINGKTERQGT